MVEIFIRYEQCWRWSSFSLGKCGIVDPIQFFFLLLGRISKKMWENAGVTKHTHAALYSLINVLLHRSSRATQLDCSHVHEHLLSTHLYASTQWWSSVVDERSPWLHKLGVRRSRIAHFTVDHTLARIRTDTAEKWNIRFVPSLRRILLDTNGYSHPRNSSVRKDDARILLNSVQNCSTIHLVL